MARNEADVNGLRMENRFHALTLLDSLSDEDSYNTNSQDLSRLNDGIGKNYDSSASLPFKLSINKDKEKKKPSSQKQIEPPILSIDTEPCHYITFDGFDEEECELVGHNCSLCGVDLSMQLVDENGFEYYDEYDECPRSLPKVCILPCNHVFHDQCFQLLCPQDLPVELQCCPECSQPII